MIKSMRLALLTLSGLISSGCATPPDYNSPNFRSGKFVNTKPRTPTSFGTTMRIFAEFAFAKKNNTVPKVKLPVSSLTTEQLQNSINQNTAIYRLGHSTILMELAGEFWLTDPIFSERASPVQWLGPKRFHPTPLGIEALPAIKGVLISHNHYDHLDKNTIKQLHPKVEKFYVPLGIARLLIDWGVSASKIEEFDWWQSRQVGEITLVNTPANHFSGRGINDANNSLWSSWVIKTPQQSLFFSGDTGYFPGFKEIGQRYGPFDLTMLENGAYNKDWADVHMLPEQTLQAHKDLKGKILMPIHNGTFELAYHPWNEPFERISQLGRDAGFEVATPTMGQRWQLQQQTPQQSWWQNLAEK